MTNGQKEFSLLKRILNRAGRPFGINPFPRAFSNNLSGEKRSASDIFETIFQNNYWGSGESRSGVGSEMDFTSRYRNWLQLLLQEYGIHKVFDAPCGDLNWITEMIDGTGIDYFGGDISKSVISAAKQKRPDLSLHVLDITLDPFPAADLWHCRDCLFHLPFPLIRQALQNFARSTIPYALITSHRARLMHRNLDVGIGGFRLLDLQRLPFSLPQPYVRIPDFRPGRDFPRYMCLWSREQVTATMRHWPAEEDSNVGQHASRDCHPGWIDWPDRGFRLRP